MLFYVPFSFYYSLLSRSLIAACTDNDVNTVRRLLVEGNSLNEATEEGDSLLSLACSAGYYELAQVCLSGTSVAVLQYDTYVRSPGSALSKFPGTAGNVCTG